MEVFNEDKELYIQEFIFSSINGNYFDSFFVSGANAKDNIQTMNELIDDYSSCSVYFDLKAETLEVAAKEIEKESTVNTKNINIEKAIQDSLKLSEEFSEIAVELNKIMSSEYNVKDSIPVKSRLLLAQKRLREEAGYTGEWTVNKAEKLTDKYRNYCLELYKFASEPSSVNNAQNMVEENFNTITTNQVDNIITIDLEITDDLAQKGQDYVHILDIPYPNIRKSGAIVQIFYSVGVIGKAQWFTLSDTNGVILMPNSIHLPLGQWINLGLAKGYSIRVVVLTGK